MISGVVGMTVRGGWRQVKFNLRIAEVSIEKADGLADWSREAGCATWVRVSSGAAVRGLERGVEAEAVAVVVFAEEKGAVLAAVPTIDAEGAGICSFGAEFIVHGLEVVHGKSE